MRLTLLLLLVFEVSYSIQHHQLPENLITNGPIEPGKAIEMDTDVLQQFIKSILPKSSSAITVTPYNEEETAVAEVKETQDQQNYQQPPVYQNPIGNQYPPGYTGRNREASNNEQQNNSHQTIYKRMAQGNEHQYQNVYQQQTGRSPEIAGRQQQQDYKHQVYKQNSQNNQEEDEEQQENINQAYQRYNQQHEVYKQQLYQQQLRQQQLQQQLRQQQIERQRFIQQQQLQQAQLKQQQFQQAQQQQQQNLQQVQQQVQLEQQQTESDEPHRQQPAYAAPGGNYQQVVQNFNSRSFQQRQERPAVPSVQRHPSYQNPYQPQENENNADDENNENPVSRNQHSYGPPSNLHAPTMPSTVPLEHQRQYRQITPRPYTPFDQRFNSGVYPSLQRVVRHHPDEEELRRPSVYFGRPPLSLRGPATEDREEAAPEEEGEAGRRTFRRVNTRGIRVIRPSSNYPS